MKKELTKELAMCMTNMLFGVSQIHYSHWLATKNHHHDILGELYTELQEELDELVEQYLGFFSQEMKVSELLDVATITKQPYMYKNLSTEKELLTFLDELTMRAQKGFDSVDKMPELKFMQDTLSNILAIIQSAKYQIKQQ